MSNNDRGSNQRTPPDRREDRNGLVHTYPGGVPAVASTVAVAVACALVAAWPARAASQVDGAVVQLVTDAIRANYSHIRTAELTLRETTRDATVTAPGVEVRQLPSGGVARIEHTPAAVRTTRVWLSGADVRVDRSQAGRANELHETLVRHDGTWTQLVGPSSAAWRRRPHEMPAMFPLDPRDFGAQDLRRSLVDELSEDTILTAQMTADGEGRSLARVVTRGAKGNETTYEFAADEGFLPTRMMTFWPDSSLLQFVEISYREVLDGQARFPVKLVRRFFAKSATHTPTDVGWRQELSREVTGEIALNDHIAENVFNLEMPVGTRVSDNIRQAVYYTADVSPVSRGIPAWYYTVAIVAALFVAAVARRLRFNH